MLMQRTIREKISRIGIGVHSGRKIHLELFPAPEGHGITFVRTDLAPHAEIRACVDHVVDTTLATSLGAGVNGSRAVVSTVEHLLSALAGLGIDNVRVHVDGPEIPVLDGSAVGFVDALLEAGMEGQRQGKRFLVVKKEICVEDGKSYARIAPGAGMHMTCSVDFDHPLISPTPFKFQFSERAFVREIASARTFGFLSDVEALRARGLARGGSLDNAIVIDQYRVLNPEGLRFPDEFVRHKTLDAIGDLSLFGMPIIGKITLHRSGHALNTELVKAVLADSRAYEVVEPARAPVEQHASFAVFDAQESVA